MLHQQDWLAEKCVAWGSRRFDALRTDAESCAVDLGHDPATVSTLFDSVQGRTDAPQPTGVFAKAVLTGAAWDARRLELFASARAELAGFDPARLPAPSEDGEMPFFEAYFSNYIEGTIFTVEEAREIVETQTPPAQRSADGHDILGTHRCVVDPIGRAAVGLDADEAVELLRTRHRTLMVGRPDIGPGDFRIDSNRVGPIEFVEPGLVPGTLLEALRVVEDVPEGFRRGVYLMLVIAEVHPFTDGNGRAARLMMNAELSARGLCRIVIPTVLRNEYVGALRRFTGGGGVAALLAVLQLAWRWSAAMPWTDRAAVEAQLEATNAKLEPADAAADGRHLLLP